MSMLNDLDYENSKIINTDLVTLAPINNIRNAKKTNFGEAFNIISDKDLMQAINQENSHEEEKLSKSSPAVLALLRSPDYDKISVIDENSDLEKLNFKHAYSALRVKFNLPETIKYPSLPINLDKTITVYPLQGEGIVTGLEYLSAKNILKEALKDLTKYFEDPELRREELKQLEKQFFIRIITGTFIPFGKDKPFFNVINELQENRRAHPKKSALERIYKDLGNMLYGKTVCGISNNRKFDARTRLMKAMTGNELANPIIGA
ncbi:hypothetical protein HOY80DRAFT_779487 [Tuber brumale]|nr:hypothetical protein HOY80DRAFT_779487 [Tuber brumale]